MGRIRKNNHNWLIIIQYRKPIFNLSMVKSNAFLITKSVSRIQGLSNEQLLKISQDVSTAMDDSEGISNTFEEKIDFSGVTVGTIENGEKIVEDLKTVFAKPIENKGIWELDGSNNVSIENTVDGVKTKKIFISSENKVYSLANNAWGPDTAPKVPDFPFFSSAARGQLFYNSKLDSLIYLGKEVVDSEEMQKIQVVPKASLLQDILKAEVPALGKNVYASINTNNLNIIANIDSNNLIRILTVSGSIDVDSTYFKGTVLLEAKSTYQYDYVQAIQVPVAMTEAINPTAVLTEVVPKKVVITEIRG